MSSNFTTFSNILAAAVAIGAFIFALMGLVDVKVCALFIALAVAVLLKAPRA